MVIRRSSQVRTRQEGQRDLLDAPHSPSTTTVSPSRTMSPKAICSPAKRLPSVDWAATPATMPRMPAEASSEAPDRAHRGEGEQHRGDRHHTDDRGHHPLDQRHLGADPADPGGVAVEAA